MTTHSANGTAKKKARFLELFSDGLTVSDACEAAAVPRRTVYNWRQADESFALAWADAEEASTERMEAEAFRRAVEGVEKPVTVARQRELVREYSDTLLIFLLKARRPQRYRENAKIEHSLAPELAVSVRKLIEIGRAANAG